MAGYITVTELRRDLDKVAQTAANDLLLQEKIDAATSIIDGALDFAYAGYSAATTKVVYGSGTPTLTLPPHQQGTVTVITPEGGTAVVDTTWTEDADGSLYLDNAYIPYPQPYASYKNYPGWGFYRYTITANWGYGLAPASIKQVTRELAKNLWFGRDVRSDLNEIAAGVAGGGQTFYSSGLSSRQLAIIKAERAKWGTGVQIA